MSEERFTYGETIDYNFFDVFEEKKYVGMIQRDSTKIVDRLNEQQVIITALKEENEQLKQSNDRFADTVAKQVSLLIELRKENEQLRLELETHKHPLWSTREAERKVNKLADNLADEVKKNGLLNEEINQLRIENMRLKKKVVNGV